MADTDYTLRLAPGVGSEPPNPGGAEDDLRPGMLLGGYIIQQRIASGGCGSVYVAQHSVLQRKVAIKVLHRRIAESSEMVERFIREAQAVNQIRHPAIVDIFEFGRTPDERPYHVMEYVDGASLQQTVAREDPLSPEELVELLRPIAAALQAAHDHGIIHRDLTPGNILVTRRDGRRAARLLDFGIAKILEGERGPSTLTAVGRKLGTPVAMAPEQIRGVGVTASVDVYAFGVVVFFALAGHFPYDGSDVSEVEIMHLEGAIPSIRRFANVSTELDEVVSRCLAKKAADRYPTITAAFAALEVAAEPRPSTATLANVSAVAILVSVEMADDAGDDDAALEDAVRVIDAAQTQLAENGYTFPVVSGTTIVAVRPLAPHGDDAETERAAAVSLARAVAARLAEREDAHASNRVVVAAHAAPGLARRTRAGLEIVAGAIVRYQSWSVDRTKSSGVYITPALELDAADAVRSC